MPVATTKRFTRTDDSSARRAVVGLGVVDVATDAKARDAPDGTVLAEAAAVGAAGTGLVSTRATLGGAETAGVAAFACARESDTGELHAEVPSKTIKQARVGE